VRRGVVARVADPLGSSVADLSAAVPDLGALGELRFGAARGRRDFVYVKASHGVGAGLVLGAGADIAGVVRVEGESTQDLSSVYVRLQPRENGGFSMGGTAASRLKADRSFVLQGAGADTFNVAVTGLPDGFYVKAIKCGEVDVLAAGLDAANAAKPLEIVVSPKAGEVKGTSGFAEKFTARGPVDKTGRTLRQLDLGRRLMRYPCSYMIYSDAFEALPASAKTLAYQRFWQVLSGKDTNRRYARLSATDLRDVIDILRDTKKDLPPYFQNVTR
jgi:hypothetical protein